MQQMQQGEVPEQVQQPQTTVDDLLIIIGAKEVELAQARIQVQRLNNVAQAQFQMIQKLETQVKELEAALEAGQGVDGLPEEGEPVAADGASEHRDEEKSEGPARPRAIK